MQNDRITKIARVCHEANRAYCQSLGDDSQLPWDSAPEWQRLSAVDGVRHAEDPNAKAEDSHKSWLAGKQRDGWKYGPVKDPDRKEHPCMVPFEELPPEQQRKDVLFLAVARALL